MKVQKSVTVRAFLVYSSFSNKYTKGYFMKNVLLALSLCFSVPAFAEYKSLEALSCTGANGLELRMTASSGSSISISTRIGDFTKEFSSPGLVQIFQSNSTHYSHIRMIGAEYTVSSPVYELHLIGAPTARKPTTLKGGIGRVENSGAYMPSTTVTCNILVK
jgi:hypothetical protein